MRESNRENHAVAASGDSDELVPTDESLPLDTIDPKLNYGSNVSSFKSQKMEDWVNSFDWNVHEVGLVALCCNDQLVKAYNIRED